MIARTDADALLDAGAVLDAAQAVGERCDVLNARTYTHPVLDGRVVVRLVPETLGAAEDLVMDFLGFETPTGPTDGVAAVGMVRSQALGFPAWALVHDPANARHAIGLVKDIERLSRAAKSKPGFAKDGFEALGAVLAATVPHFLPTFFEQAARVLLAAGHEKPAGVMFGRAREAERAHGLTIDEETQSSAFVEFALAGALTTKALTGYAKSLAARCPTDEAYARFRRVCVERVAGGLPPYAEMPADLRRLLKAAKLDQDAEDQSVLRDLLPLPATARAGRKFWEAYQKPLADLSRADPGVRGLLLNLNPHIPDADVLAADELWLSILVAGHATEGLTAPQQSVPTEAMPRDGAAGWLSQFAHGRGERERIQSPWPPPELLSLVGRMAPRLRADGVPVRLDHTDGVTLDLLDACLAAGIPVADPLPGLAFPTSTVLAERTPSRPDLVAIAADERFRPALFACVDSVATTGRTRTRTLLDTAGLRHVLADWLDHQADVLAGSSLPEAESALKKLVRLSQFFADDEVPAVNPGAWTRIVSFDAATVLADTLRLGILDEFSWPALEEACAGLASPGRGQHGWRRPKLRVTDQWPYLVVTDEMKAVVVSHDRVLHREDLPPRASRRASHPVLSWTEGRLVVADHEDTTPTGDGTHLVAEGHSSFPLPDGVDASPLGTANGLAGWRLVADESGGLTGVGIDGRTVRLDRLPPPTHRNDRPVLVAAIRFPGADTDIGIVWHAADFPQRSFQFTLVGPQGQILAVLDLGAQNPDYARGTACIAPWRFWHFFVARDPDGSAALRTITAERLRPLLGIAAEPADEKMADRASRALVEIPADDTVITALTHALPEIADADVRAGIAGFVNRARLSANLAAYIRTARNTRSELESAPHPEAHAAASPTPEPAPEPKSAPDDDIRLAVELLAYLQNPVGQEPPASSVKKTRHSPDAFTRLPLTEELEHAWMVPHWMGVRTDLYRTAVAGWMWTDTKPPLILRVARAMEASGFLRVAGRSRTLIMRPAEHAERFAVIETPTGHAVAFQRGGAVVHDRPSAWQAVEISRDGTFGDVPGWTVEAGSVLPEWPWPDAGPQRFADLFAERGAPEWRSVLATRFAEATGLTVKEATVILLGFPGFVGNRADPPALEVRKRFGFWKVSTWSVATRRFLAMQPQLRHELLAALLPATAEAFWTSGPDIERGAAWWLEHFGDQIAVPEELLQEVDSEIRDRYHDGRYAQEPSAIVRDILDPRDGCQLRTSADLRTKDFELCARILPWLAYRLPVGDPLRATLPEAARIIRRRLLEPNRVIDVYVPVERDTVAAMLAVTARTDGDVETVGPFVFERDRPSPRPIGLMPSLLSGLDDPALDLVSDNGYLAQSPPSTVLRLLLGDALEPALAFGRPEAEAEAEADADADAGPEPYPAQDPTRSVPQLVAEASAKLGLGEAAAALYLMLLALPDPTDRHQASWTGWKSARLKQAREDLAATDLVVQGTRPRAGRSLFLPGGWHALPAPFLPLETWKALSLGVAPDGGVPLGVVVPLVPVPDLFAAAWRRVTDGDAPRFDDLGDRLKR